MERESPQEKLVAEVSTFVGAYLCLVNLSYCEVPLLSGRPPSDFVPKYSVFGEVTQHKDCIWSGNPVLVRSVRRLQVKLERERLALSRELVASGASYTVLFIFSVWVILSWLCVVATKQGLQYVHPLHSLVFLHAMGQALIALTGNITGKSHRTVPKSYSVHLLQSSANQLLTISR